MQQDLPSDFFRCDGRFGARSRGNVQNATMDSMSRGDGAVVKVESKRRTSVSFPFMHNEHESHL